MPTPEGAGDSLAGNGTSTCLSGVPGTDEPGRECWMGLKSGSGMGRARNAQAGACRHVLGCRHSTSGEAMGLGGQWQVEDGRLAQFQGAGPA